MKVHYIQHVPFESLGYIEYWLKDHHHTVSSTKTWKGEGFPQHFTFDVLIVMGGPMSVYDDHLHPWLHDEKLFLADAIREQKKIMGICLGAQLLAVVLGAGVASNKHKEIGWFPINFHNSFSRWLGADVADMITAFHWHGDKFDIPHGGENHAASEACSHQLFTLGENIIGIQFHLEATPESINEMLEHGKDELVEGDYIQHKDTIQVTDAYFSEGTLLMKKILEKMFQ